jgi:multiple sugar transport system substrate-binding protein
MKTFVDEIAGAKGRTAELGPNTPGTAKRCTAVQAVLSGKSTPQAALDAGQAKATG